MQQVKAMKTATHTMKKSRQQKRKVSTIQEQYRKYFVPAPSPTWQNEYDNFSLEQPSPLKWVPSETTYGVNALLLPIVTNA